MSNPIYNYPIKSCMFKDVELLDNLTSYQGVFFCVYNVNTKGKYPFLQYLLFNDGENMVFPEFMASCDLDDESIIPYLLVYLSGILQVTNYGSFVEQIQFDGFFKWKSNLYVFIDLNKFELNVDDAHLKMTAGLCLVHEIVNVGMYLDMNISAPVTRFFKDNLSLLWLYDEYNTQYEIPIVGYVAKPTEKKVDFTYIFGQTAEDKMSILGPYFYFMVNAEDAITSCKNLLEKDMSDKKGNRDKCGIVRFALFCGAHKYIENAPNDPVDKSVIKMERLMDVYLDNKIEKMTMRISDYDGNWANEYDSVYLADIELDDGSKIEISEIIVLKAYDQQLPLTYHLLQF